MTQAKGAAAAIAAQKRKKSVRQYAVLDLYTVPPHLKSMVKVRKAAGWDRAGEKPWGGDKIAFEPVADVPADCQRYVRTATRIIDMARELKRDKKALYEKRKEETLNDIRRVATAIQAVRPETDIQPYSKAAGQKQGELLVAKREGKVKLASQDLALALNLVLLSTDGIVAMNKKVLHEFHDRIGKSGWDFKELTQQFQAANLTVKKDGAQHVISVKRDGRTEVALYRVYWGVDRVEAKPDEEGVFQQRGQQGKPDAETRRKDYVTDVNGVLTRRFVTRAITYNHLATMMGFEMNHATGKAEQTGFAGQFPRGAGDVFGRNADEFDVNSSAVVDPNNWDDRYDVTSGPETGPESGSEVWAARSTVPRDRNSRMNINERTSMQVRNGSGAAQSMLSTASTQQPVGDRDPKVIRGNKGERFDNTHFNVAVLELDLSVAKKLNIKFVNQHSTDSQEYKVAYDRFKTAKGPGIKREAKLELDEYIYSGRKNREVTIERIPNAMITKVMLTGGVTRWAGMTLELDQWHDWAKVEKALRDYVTPARLERVHRMAMRAEEEDVLASGVRK